MKRLVLTISIAAALAGCSRASSTPAGVVEDFMRRMDNGNCSGIGDLLSQSSKAMAGPKIEQVCNANAAMKKEMQGKGAKTIASVNVLEATENGDRATVRLEGVFSDGTKEGGDPIVVVRENGAWKIDLMATGANSSNGQGMGAGGAMTPPATMTPPAGPANPMVAPPGNVPNEAETVEPEANEEAESTNAAE